MTGPAADGWHWRRSAVAGAIVTSMTVGMRDVLSPRDDREDDAVVIEAPDPSSAPLERITLYLHPDVPEASLAVLRPWIAR